MSLKRLKLSILIIVVAALLVPTSACFSTSVSAQDYYRSQIHNKSKPYAFDYISWEISALSSLTTGGTVQNKTSKSEREVIDRISTTLVQHGIPIFPPMNVNIENPPLLLVVSPRDHIEYFDRVLLSPILSPSEIKNIEDSIDELGLSSLVIELGGFGGTYPPIVNKSSDLSFVINAVLEEWLHQYLAIKPMGFLYLLDCIGISQDPNVIIMNETLVGIASKEIGSEVYNQYYRQAALLNSNNESFIMNQFNFDQEMRETRKQVDMLLAEGDITGAESYMEMRRLMFSDHGYYIRKLNQAYLAFNGIYAYGPSGVSPIYKDLQQLRKKSGTVADFINVASKMTSYSDLLEALGSGFH